MTIAVKAGKVYGLRKMSNIDNIKNYTVIDLEKWSNEALKQIGELRYDSEMKEDGITEILKFGIAFSGKKVCVRTE
jgi:hypothetical protein